MNPSSQGGGGGALMRRSESSSIVANKNNNQLPEEEEEESKSLLASAKEEARKAAADHKPVKVKDEDRAISMRAMRPRPPAIEVSPLAGESLTGMALRLGVPAAEIRRLNGIMMDSEMHALSRVLVPARVNILSRMNGTAEGLAAVHGRSPAQQPGWPAKAGGDGWTVEHFSTPPGLSSSTTSTSRAASGSNSPAIALSDESGEESRRVSLIAASSVADSREVRKARKMFRHVDKGMAVIRQKNEAIVSTRIPPDLLVDGHGDKGDEDEWEDIEDDEWDQSGDASAAAALLPSSASDSPSSRKLTKVSKMSCLLCVSVIVVAVVLILLFADHEYLDIQKEVSHGSNASGEDGEDQAAPGRKLHQYIDS